MELENSKTRLALLDLLLANFEISEKLVLKIKIKLSNVYQAITTIKMRQFRYSTQSYPAQYH